MKEVRAMEAICRISSVLAISNESTGLGGYSFYQNKRGNRNSPDADFEPFLHNACDRMQHSETSEKDLPKVLDAILRL